MAYEWRDCLFAILISAGALLGIGQAKRVTALAGRAFHGIDVLAKGRALSLAWLLYLFCSRPAARPLAAAGAAGVLALSLSAFFWLPAFAERGQVQLEWLQTGNYREWLVDPAGAAAKQLETTNRQTRFGLIDLHLHYPHQLVAPPKLSLAQAGLGVLAMTVGLVHSESARDLRTLTAAGARRRTRRALTAATAGALALCGAIIGTACAYLALLAWYHREVHWLAHPPVLNLAALLVGLPTVAYLGGWLLAGREARGIGRQPLD